jgi:hypothetical protein
VDSVEPGTTYLKAEFAESVDTVKPAVCASVKDELFQIKNLYRRYVYINRSFGVDTYER